MNNFEVLVKKWESSILTPEDTLLIVGGDGIGTEVANNCKCNGNNCNCHGGANNCDCNSSVTTGNNCSCGIKLGGEIKPSYP